MALKALAASSVAVEGVAVAKGDSLPEEQAAIMTARVANAGQSNFRDLGIKISSEKSRLQTNCLYNYEQPPVTDGLMAVNSMGMPEGLLGLPEQLPADEHAADFARPGADLVEFGIAQ